MKSATRLSALIIAFIITLSTAAFAESTDLRREYLKKLQKDNPDDSFFQSLNEDDIMIESYGSFSGGEVFHAVISGIEHSDHIYRLEIAGYIFTFPAGNENERFLYFKDGAFMTVSDAYKTGVLTRRDIRDIAAARGDLTELPFTDTGKDAWYYNAVELTYHRNLFEGTNGSTFEPSLEMTRAMLVTVLWRLELSGTANGTSVSVPPDTEESRFSDVDAGKWYTSAVIWADYYGIVLGTDEKHFCPNDIVTREQLAAILYRYASFKGEDTSKRADISVFPDSASVHAYAADAVSWAAAKGIIKGTNTGENVILDARSGATRAQVCEMLMRFIAG